MPYYEYKNIKICMSGASVSFTHNNQRAIRSKSGKSETLYQQFIYGNCKLEKILFNIAYATKSNHPVDKPGYEAKILSNTTTIKQQLLKKPRFHR